MERMLGGRCKGYFVSVKSVTLLIATSIIIPDTCKS